MPPPAVGVLPKGVLALVPLLDGANSPSPLLVIGVLDGVLVLIVAEVGSWPGGVHSAWRSRWPVRQSQQILLFLHRRHPLPSSAPGC
jgi:hypothetical protein